jgi:hypothetical protein
MRPGIRTTEFWLTALTAIWGAVEPSLPPLARALVPAVAAVAYSISRGLAKHGANASTVGDP